MGGAENYRLIRASLESQRRIHEEKAAEEAKRAKHERLRRVRQKAGQIVTRDAAKPNP